MSKIAIIFCLLLGLSHAQCKYGSIQLTAVCLPSAGWPVFVSMRPKTIVRHVTAVRWHSGTGIS